MKFKNILELYTSDNIYLKKYGGYNFAFESNSRYATQAARDGKYGSEAVIFTNSGVKAYHNSDNEEQVIFWGKDVDPRGIIYIGKNDDDEWCVGSHPKSRKDTDKECLYVNEDFGMVTDLGTN